MTARRALLGLAGSGVLGVALLTLSGCDFGTNEPFVRRTLGFTFEADLEPWQPDATDLDEPPVEWSIERSDVLSNEGDWAVRFSLENLNDAAKIWIELPVVGLTPGVTYRVNLAFDFASSDGEVNAWEIIAGASPINPETFADLPIQGSTVVPGGPGDFTWIRKEYTFDTMPGSDGRLWLLIGVWGTSEFTRTYFVDQVNVEIVRGG